MNNPTRLERLEALRLSVIDLINDGIDLPDTLVTIEAEIAKERTASSWAAPKTNNLSACSQALNTTELN